VAGVGFASLTRPSRPELQINAANALHSKFKIAQKEKRAIFLMLALNLILAALAF
jgi:hypothetical protein